MTVLQNLSDDDLLRRMQAGSEQAFTTLYRRRHPSIYRFALQMSGSSSVAEEVTQEVFMALIQQSGSYNCARGSLQSYLYGIARHHILRHFERSGPLVPIGTGGDDDFAIDENALGDLTRAENIELVRQAILALPAAYREVVVLCDLHEMSYANAAEAVGCALGTVRSRLHRGRALLLERLRMNRAATGKAAGKCCV